MREPDCLNRRYRALDEMINELSSAISPQGSEFECPYRPKNDPGIRLMCQFWNILKEDPNCNLPQAVHQRMCASQSSIGYPQEVTCYMANETRKGKELKNKIKKSCCSVPGNEDHQEQTSCSTPVIQNYNSNEVLPLSKVLCNLKEAASFDQKCNVKLAELQKTEKYLQGQITYLENREKEGVKMLKQADCMWACMEDAYKAKVAESLERQKNILKQLKEVETSATKWRKNKKDLEFQLNNINKCHTEMSDKINQKTNDINYMDMEIVNFKKIIESNKKESAAVKSSLNSKKNNSKARISQITENISKLQEALKKEHNNKKLKEEKGNNYIKEAREDLQKICRVLLQKKLENEDLKAEKDALLSEINLLKDTCDICKDKCRLKQSSILDEIKKHEVEIAQFKVKCIRCHECTDTDDVRKLCTDCPRCVAERDCILEGDHCTSDYTADCVCQSVKQQFLGNVFENMSSVLERQIKTKTGKVVAEAVLKCLKKSRNGKLNEETRNVLQDFILTSVKRNLNLTIVGGAVKTRCELDSDTYKQLMLCLKQVKAVKPPKADKGTIPKKESCRRWGESSECNCPKGPKDCICSKKAPPPPNDPTPCPPPDKEDAGEEKICPHKENMACGLDCGMHSLDDVESWRPDPCSGPSCKYTKDMRTAQCILGPDSYSSITSQSYKSAIPHMFDPLDFETQIDCGCSKNLATCPRDVKPLKAENSTQTFRDNICNLIWGNWNGRTCELDFIENEVKENPVPEKVVLKQKEDNCGINKVHAINTPVAKGNELKTIFKDELAIPYTTRHVGTETIISYNKRLTQISVNTTKVDSGQSAIITRTQSGNYVTELEEKAIELIKKKTMTDPIFFVSLRETLSGQKVLNFNPSDNISSIIKVVVKKTPCGNIYLEIDDTLLKTLLSTEEGRKEEMNKEIQVKKVDYISHSRNKQLPANRTIETNIVTNKKEGTFVSPKGGIGRPAKKNKHIRKEQEFVMTSKLEMDSDDDLNAKVKKQIFGCKELIRLQNDAADKSSSYTTVSDELSSLFGIQKEHDFTNDAKLRENLHKMHHENNGKIRIKVHSANGMLVTLQAKLTKTSSGHEALDVKDLSCICETPTEERPVLLNRSDSGTYTLFIDEKRNIEVSNTVLRKTLSGRVLLVFKDCVPKSSTKNKAPGRRDNLFKIKVKGINNIEAESSDLVKLTRSGNYTLVLNKEFEKQHRKTIDECIVEETECYIQLQISEPNTIVINFREFDDDSAYKQNAVLVRSPSGNIKIIIKGPVFEALSSSSITSAKNRSSKVFETLLSKLPNRASEVSNEYSLSPKIRDIKSSSDSNLYKNIRIKLQARERLLAAPSATLKRTSSGEYAVILYKESKKDFVNDLKSYLANSPQGLIPITTTTTGEITIILSGDTKGNVHYGSLKITPSGNVYIVVQEEVLKRMTEEATDKNINEYDIGSRHLIKKLTSPEDKAVLTTNTEQLQDCVCELHECISRKIEDKDKNWLYSGHEEKFKIMKQKCGIPFKKIKSSVKEFCGKKKCGPVLCKDPCYANRSKDEKTHIVIKPCECNKEQDNKTRHDEQCFYYLSDAVCPVHKDRYKSVSNEILEISGNCTTKRNIDVNFTEIYSIDDFKDTDSGHHDCGSESSDWDALSFMSPKLPTFLRDYIT